MSILRTTRQTGPFGPRLDTRLISKKLYHFPALDYTELIVDFILKISAQCIIFFLVLSGPTPTPTTPPKVEALQYIFGARCSPMARHPGPSHVIPQWRILQFVFASKDLKVISLRRLAARVVDETHCHSSSATIQCLSGYCEHLHRPILSSVAVLLRCGDSCYVPRTSSTTRTA